MVDLLHLTALSPSFNIGTLGVAPQDAGVASATVTVGQQLGASLGTSLLNTIFASAVAAHLHAAGVASHTLARLALAHGYDTAFWWAAGIFAAGAVIGVALLRGRPMVRATGPSRATGEAATPERVSAA